jgi:hypothetical protein
MGVESPKSDKEHRSGISVPFGARQLDINVTFVPDGVPELLSALG